MTWLGVLLTKLSWEELCVGIVFAAEDCRVLVASGTNDAAVDAPVNVGIPELIRLVDKDPR